MTNQTDEDFLKLQQELSEEKKRRIAGSPTMLKALEDKLKEESLSYKNIEAVTVLYPKEPEGEAAKILDRIQAKKILGKFKLVNTHYFYGEGCNLPFYAYTKDLIFYLKCSDEMGNYWINVIPRNPTDKKIPSHL